MTSSANRGKFIFFEGMDFSGKTTYVNVLKEILDEKGIEVIITREPGGGKVSEDIRTLLLSNSDMTSAEQAMLFQTARSVHCRKVIEPALNEGKWVISDRYIISSLVYQHSEEKFFRDTFKSLELTNADAMIYVKCGLEETLRRKGIRDDINHLDERHTKYYNEYSGRYDKYAERLKDITTTLDTNLSREELKPLLYNLVNKLEGNENV